MAKFNESPITPGLNGMTGGVVFGKNRYGSYMYLKGAVVGGLSDAQMNECSYMAYVSRCWSYDLSEEQYAAWSVFADKIMKTDKLGNTYELDNRQVFIRCNRKLLKIGLPPILDPPKNKIVQHISDFKFAITANDNERDIRMFFKPAINKNTRILIYATRDLRNSINYYRDDRFKLIGYVNSLFKSGESIMPLYNSNPLLISNWGNSFKIVFRLIPVSVLSGFAAPMVEKEASFKQAETIIR